MMTMKNDMFLRFENVSEFIVVGCSMEMSLTNFKPAEVWQKFMQSKNKLTGSDTECYYDVNSYHEHYFECYSPDKPFNKLAGVKSTAVVDNFDSLVIPDGRYAVFIHEGLAADISKTFQHIFAIWLPQNNEQLDHRPHFMKLPIDYNRDSTIVKEEIYIPLK